MQEGYGRHHYCRQFPIFLEQQVVSMDNSVGFIFEILEHAAARSTVAVGTHPKPLYRIWGL